MAPPAELAAKLTIFDQVLGLMSDDTGDDTGLRYDHMVEDALRGVVRQSLTYAADNGLPGEHHFYITFRTDYPGVDIPAHLRERYPSEMTIVLQYQFWDLQVNPDHFEVTLSFADVPEQLHIPYDAVVSFADPAVRFGLQFESGEGLEDDEAEDADQAGVHLPEEASSAQDTGVQDLETPNSAAKGSGNKGASGQKPDGGKDKAGAAEGEDAGDDDKVVTLDSFRKKQT